MTIHETPMSASWFDGHLDLAYLSVCGRNLAHPGDETSGGCVNLHTLRAGGVEWCLATIFTEPGPDAAAGGFGYCDSGDLDGAEEAGLRQLEVYRSLEREDHIRIVRDMREPGAERTIDPAPRQLSVVILMEGADPIRSPEHLGRWFNAGVRIIGLTWAMGTRYAGGNARPGPLSGLGRDLIAAIDSLGMVHDISHLADEGIDQLFQCTRGPIIASHSNCRALLDGVNQRHLLDEQIREIGLRHGIVGLNLYSPFLTTGRRATISDCLRHVDRICELMGHRRGVALGSDMDGGFAPDRLPMGLDHPTRLHALRKALGEHGWSNDEIEGFAWRNWTNFLSRVQTIHSIT